MNRFELLAQYRCPRYEDYPAIPLYKDQVVSFLSQAVAPFYDGEQPPVTAAMVNNYVKLKVISPPERKKYTRDQVVCLYVTFLLKQVLSMEEIRQLLAREFAPGRTEAAYGQFVALLEGTLALLAGPAGGPEVTPQPLLLEAVTRSLLYRRYAALLLQEQEEAAEPEEEPSN